MTLTCDGSAHHQHQGQNPQKVSHLANSSSGTTPFDLEQTSKVNLFVGVLINTYAPESVEVHAAQSLKGNSLQQTSTSEVLRESIGRGVENIYLLVWQLLIRQLQWNFQRTG